MVSLRTMTIFPQVFQAFTADRQPVNPIAEISLRIASTTSSGGLRPWRRLVKTDSSRRRHSGSKLQPPLSTRSRTRAV